MQEAYKEANKHMPNEERIDKVIFKLPTTIIYPLKMTQTCGHNLSNLNMLFWPFIYRCKRVWKILRKWCVNEIEHILSSKLVDREKENA